jgi:asparagine synthase (glutamine-hydrolysing)
VARLWAKCQATGGGEQFSNADNMALVGVLSTGLLWERLVRDRPGRDEAVPFRTVVDRMSKPEVGTLAGAEGGQGSVI